MRAIASRFTTVARDRRASVLAETALILPVLITLVLGGLDVARFALLQQKLSRMVMGTTDMVSQGATVSIPELDIIFQASGTMLRPFAAGSSQVMFISSVSVTGAALPRVDWQRTGGGSLAGQTSKLGLAGGNATLPTGFAVESGGNAIFTEVYYDFSPMFMPILVPPTVLYHRAVFRPRQSSLTTLCVTPC